MGYVRSAAPGKLGSLRDLSFYLSGDGGYISGSVFDSTFNGFQSDLPKVESLVLDHIPDEVILSIHDHIETIILSLIAECYPVIAKPLTSEI